MLRRNAEWHARPRGAQLDPQHAARRNVASRLSVGSPLIRNRDAQRVQVRQRGAVAAALLADDEQQADAALAAGAQPLGRGDLRGQDPFRVARPAAVQRVRRARWTGKNGGTQSKCVESTTTGSSSVARMFEQPRASGCSTTV